MKSLLEQLKDLQRRANATDSKKEDFELRQQAREIARQLQAQIDNKLNKFPDELEITIKVNKTIKYDTSEFKSWLQSYVEDYELYDPDLMEEFVSYFEEYFDPYNFLDSDDYKIEYARH